MPVQTTYRHPVAISFPVGRWLAVFCKSFKDNQILNDMKRAKRFLLFALLALLSAVACEKPNQPKSDSVPDISIPAQSQAIFNSGISFPALTGESQNQPQTQTITFTTAESWTSTVSETKASTWLSVEPSSGGAGTVNMTVKAQPNDTDQSRFATVSIKCGSMSKSFTVSQAGKEYGISVSPATLSISAEGKTEGVTVTCNGDWTLTGETDWCRPSVTSGTGNAIVNFTILANERADQRTAQYTFTCKEKTAVVCITQSGKAFSLTVSPVSLSFMAGGGVKQVQISCNGDWSVSGQPDWCSLSASSGSQDSTIKLTVAANGADQRTAQLVFTCGDKSVNLIITQVAGGWQNLEFVHKSLYMMFTSEYCGYSSTMNQKMHALDAVIGDKYHRVDIYGRGVNNVMGESIINYPDAPKLESLLWFATPCGVFDFRRQIHNVTDRTYFSNMVVTAVNEQIEHYPPVTGTAFNSSVSERTLSVQGKIFSHEAETFKLIIYLLEDKVSDGGSIIHDDVLRKSFTDTLGDPFSVGKNATRDFQYSITLPDNYKVEDLSILVIVQRQYGSDQTGREVFAVDYYVDNCRKARVGEDANLELSGYLGSGGNEGIGIDDGISF